MGSQKVGNCCDCLLVQFIFREVEIPEPGEQLRPAGTMAQGGYNVGVSSTFNDQVFDSIEAEQRTAAVNNDIADRNVEKRRGDKRHLCQSRDGPLNITPAVEIDPLQVNAEDCTALCGDGDNEP